MTSTISADLWLENSPQAEELRDARDEAVAAASAATAAAVNLVYPEKYGAVGDGVADDTAELQAALDYVGGLGGGIVSLAPGKKYLIDSADMTVPANVALIGGAWSGGQRAGNDYSNMEGLILNSARTIRTQRGSRISAVIRRKGLTKPNSHREGLTGRAAFAGTAITNGGPDVMICDSFIIGFNRAILSENREKLTIDRVRGDCTNGIRVFNATDTTRISDVHFWNYFTAHTPWEIASWSVSGAANNGAGLIRITSAGHGVETGDIIGITGIVGTTEGNGRWVATKIDANTIDLQGSAFTNAYASGGTIWSVSGARRGVFLDIEDSDGVIVHGPMCYAYDVGIRLAGGAGTVMAMHCTAAEIDANPNYGDAGTIGLKVEGSVYNSCIHGGYIAGFATAIDYNSPDVRGNLLSGVFVGGRVRAVDQRAGNLIFSGCDLSGAVHMRSGATSMRVMACGTASATFSGETEADFRKIMRIGNRASDENLWLSHRAVNIATPDSGVAGGMRSRIFVPHDDRVRIGARHPLLGGALMFDTKGGSAQFMMGVDDADNELRIGKVTGTSNTITTLGPQVDHGAVGQHELNLSARPSTPATGVFYVVDFETRRANGTGSVFATLAGGAEDLTVGAHRGYLDVRVADGSGNTVGVLRVASDFSLQHLPTSTTFVTASGHLRLRPYTLAALPSPNPAGQMIYVSDLTGGAEPCHSDGTNWRRMSDRTVAS